MGLEAILSLDSGYEDRQNNRISLAVLAALSDDPDYRRVAHTHIAEFCISTVWMGSYTSLFGGPFETVIYDRYMDCLVEMRRYRVEGVALVDHMMAAASCRSACYQLMPGSNEKFATPYDDQCAFPVQDPARVWLGSWKI